MGRARSARWSGAAGVAGVAALALAAAGCTTPHHDRAVPAPPASASASASPGPAGCANPRYEFTPAVETATLTYVSPVITITAPDGGPLDSVRPLAVRPLTATAASSAGEADARRAYQAFVRQSGNPNLPEFGVAAEPFGGAVSVRINRPGRFVEYAMNQVVTASFVRLCGDAGAGLRDAAGSLTTFWPRFPMTGVLNCAEQPTGDAQRQAVQLMCGTAG